MQEYSYSYTKHIYAGTQRIASKVGDIEAFGADPRREEYAGANLKEVDFGEIYDTQTKALLARYDSLGVMNKPRELNDYVGGQSFCCGEKELVSNNQTGDNTFETPDYEQLIFFYHPDHLGSTALVTDNDGNVVQSVAYIPYGEVFIEERNGTWNTPYLFNGKELDEETGLYYYGARYLNPTNGMWLSTDPLFEDYKGVSPYAYCMGNPVKHVDVEGEFPILANLVGAAVGAATEYGCQVLSNCLEKGTIDGNCFTDVDYSDIAVAAGEGFLTCGASTGKTIVVKIGSAVVKNAVDVKKDGDRGVQLKTNRVGEVVDNTLYDLTAGAIVDYAGGKAVKALAKDKGIDLKVKPVYQSKNKRNEVFKEKYKSKYGVNPSMKEIKAYNKANDFKIEKNRNKAYNKAVNEQINGYFEAQPGAAANTVIKYYKDKDK